MFDYSDFIKSNWNDWVVGFNAARQAQLFQGIGLAKIQRWQMLIVLISLAGGISYGLFLLIQLRSKEHIAPVERAWRKLLLKMRKRGMGKLNHETALDYALRVESKELVEIAERYTRCRYGKVAFSEAETRTLIADLLALSIPIGASSKATGQRSTT
jgi:hypothetical protein